MLHPYEKTHDLPIVPFIREAEVTVRKPWFMPERRLLDYLLIYIQEGDCLVIAEGKKYLFKAGEFCLLQPYCLHSLRGLTSTITPYAHFDVFYNKNRRKSFPTKVGQIDLSEYADLVQPTLHMLNGIDVPIKLSPSQPLHFRDTMLKMIHTWQDPTLTSQLEAQACAMHLILAIVQDYSEHAVPVEKSPQSLDWAAAYFAIHISENLTIADLAKRANLSPSRFSAVFRRHYGASPHRYLLRLRLQNAKELLVTTSLTLVEIAEYCGFADPSHFSKMFKKETGLSPGEYRRTNL